MKSLYIILIVLGISVSAIPQEKDKKVVEITFKVDGACNQCKERIEDAAFVKGVKHAEWNKYTKQIKVAYRMDKTTEQTIKKSIAAAGHDADTLKAKAEVYNNLPGCCQYRSEHIKTH